MKRAKAAAWTCIVVAAGVAAAAVLRGAPGAPRRIATRKVMQVRIARRAMMAIEPREARAEPPRAAAAFRVAVHAGGEGAPPPPTPARGSSELKAMIAALEAADGGPGFEEEALCGAHDLARLIAGDEESAALAWENVRDRRTSDAVKLVLLEALAGRPDADAEPCLAEMAAGFSVTAELRIDALRALGRRPAGAMLDSRATQRVAEVLVLERDESIRDAALAALIARMPLDPGARSAVEAAAVRRGEAIAETARKALGW